ncbi:hypothetical protein Q4E40_02795 [Pontibacter sp. BT731]|uniref:hypothetical protein n=1 Tax=Pontibacter coccineus TaxID=3063328 RepID=UPI0026E1CCC5|nr:hypothetical protein [Pontibacter sp. BT731]MDO6389041.1 hypothetical protein [Pontibacter sp. BT731]
MNTRRNVKLTGKFYFRRNFFGSQILMVEESGQYEDPIYFDLGPVHHTYREATERDVQELNLRSAIGDRGGILSTQEKDTAESPGPQGIAQKEV